MSWMKMNFKRKIWNGRREILSLLLYSLSLVDDGANLVQGIQRAHHVVCPLHLCCWVRNGHPWSEVIVMINWVMPFDGLVQAPQGVKSRSHHTQPCPGNKKLAGCHLSCTNSSFWCLKLCKLAQVWSWTIWNCHFWPFFT